MQTRIFMSVFAVAVAAVAQVAVSASGAGVNVSVPCTPTERTDEYGRTHFNEDRALSQGKHFDCVLLGDSITDFWVNPNLSIDGDLAKTINMGIGSDRVQNLLWRVRNGALDGYTAKCFTLLIGVNNAYQLRMDENRHCDRAEDIAEAIRLILDEIVSRHPESKVFLMPCLPYAFDSRYFDALEVRTTNEDVNDRIIKFVDSKRVFWVDLRSQFLNADGTCNKACFRAGEYDAVGHCLHPNVSTYSRIFKPALAAAMRRHLAVTAGRAQVTDPSLGFASAAPDGVSKSAMITVSGIFLGTDAKAVPVTTYSIAYTLDGGARTPALANQTLPRNSFVIPNVTLGKHVCKVWVTTADDKVLTTSIEFTMTDGWTGRALPCSGDAIRNDGALVFAYALGNFTVNGVPFAKASGGIDNDDITWPYGGTSGSPVPPGVERGAYADLLTHCWWSTAGDRVVTLKRLTPGATYLVQIVGYRNYEGFDRTHVWIRESYWDSNYIKVLGDGWPCGGALTGIFTATAETKTFTIIADGNYALNGIQVRRLDAGGQGR